MTTGRTDVSTDELEGLQLGPWRLGTRIGRGGMGNVLLAERSDGAYVQKAAVKVIRRGMDSEQVLQRFRTERQILATLSHPNISALLDGGSLPDGRPYLVMEHVNGERIDRWCDARRATVPDRLRLFLRVCDAVAFAHQRLVVHRDLKPGNILVTNDGVPKLLDFGIAKLLDAGGPERSRTGVVGPMTPEYASPEQVWALPVTTATDVYALGVVLYELLTGRRPYKVAERTGTAVLEAIAKTEPFPPSSAAGSGLEREGEPPRSDAEIAAARGTTPEGLRRRLRGDLDVILMTALRKQAERRYPSVEALADDLRRHLDGRPVEARADSWSYRAGRFVRRHAIPVAASAIAVLGLVAGAAVAAAQARVARAQRDRAEQRQQDTLRLTNAMLFELFDGIDAGPVRARGLLVERARGYLDQLAREAPDDPALLHELASAYTRLAEVQGGTRLQAGVAPDAEGARRSQDQAVALRGRLAQIDPAHFENRRELAYLAIQDGVRQAIEGRAQEAVARHEAAVGALQALAAERPGDRTTRRHLMTAHFHLAQALSSDALANVGRPADALPHFDESARLAEALLAEQPGDLAVRTSLAATHTEAATALAQLGRGAEGDARLGRAIPIQEWLVQHHPDSVLYRRELAVAYGNLAASRLRAGDKGAALELAQRALPLYESIAKDVPGDGDAQRDLAIGHRNVGKAMASGGDPRGSLPHVERATSLLRDLVRRNPDSAFLARQLAFTHLVAADSLRLAGDRAAALARIQEGIRIGQALVAREAGNMVAWRTLAMSYAHAGETAEALGRWSEARAWHVRSRDAWRTMQQAGELPGNAAQLQQAEAAIARCDAALRGARS